ncbi:hypothetical protein XENORESO_018200, partial [Xenotaenia resolanae]
LNALHQEYVGLKCYVFVQNALQFIKQCWKMQGRPLFLVLIREDNIKGSRFNPVLDMLASFKKGIIGGVKVHVDRLQVCGSRKSKQL